MWYSWRYWAIKNLHNSWRYHINNVQELKENTIILEFIVYRAWNVYTCDSFIQNIEHIYKCLIISKLNWSVYSFLLFLSNHQWYYHERAEWYEDIVYLSWAHTFFLESTDDSCIFHTQLERSCCDVVLHCKALQLFELQIYHWFRLAFTMSEWKYQQNLHQDSEYLDLAETWHFQHRIL